MLTRLQRTIAAALRLPSVRLFVGVYLLALLVLLWAGGEMASYGLIHIGVLIWESIYLALTVWLTPHPPAIGLAGAGLLAGPDVRGRALGGQLLVVGVLLLLSVLYSLTFHGPRLGLDLGTLPFAAPWVMQVTNLGPQLVNPFLYFVAPLLTLLIFFRVSPDGLGLRRGYRSWVAGLVWIAVNALFAVVMLLIGGFTARWVAQRLLGNFIQNGFVEEFLWRGVVQTRLAHLFDPAWGAVLSALLFGFWHLPANLVMFQGEWWPALAYCVVAQARFGLYMSVLFLRTRSLLAPTLAHLFTNLNPLNFM